MSVTSVEKNPEAPDHERSRRRTCARLPTFGSSSVADELGDAEPRRRRCHARREWIDLKDRTDGTVERVEAAELFVLIGAEPCTDWLPPTVAA